DGASTYLALIFGTLLSSQGTDASFVLTLSGFPPGFPSVFPTLPDPISVPFPVGIHFRWPVGGPLPIRLPGGFLSASPTLSEVFDRTDRPLVPDLSGSASPEPNSRKLTDVKPPPPNLSSSRQLF
ncbi:hypothetical protein E4K73_36870, partial [Streptomyces sp. IB201691-2A2]